MKYDIPNLKIVLYPIPNPDQNDVTFFQKKHGIKWKSINLLKLQTQFNNHNFEFLIMITQDTCDFRHLCRNKIDEKDIVLEVGSSQGVSTSEIASKVGPNGFVIGIDISDECVKQAKSKNIYENVQYLKLDPFVNQIEMQNLIFEQKFNKLVIDVGGDRNKQQILNLFCSIIENFYKFGIKFPNLMIIKSEEIYEHAIPNIDLVNGLVKNPTNQIQNLQELQLNEFKLKIKDPLKFPKIQLYNDQNNSEEICRYQNQDSKGCTNIKCLRNHESCHYCLIKGHKAINCQSFIQRLNFNKN